MNVNFGCKNCIVSTQPKKMPPFVLEENPERPIPPFAIQENPNAKTSTIYDKMTPEKFQAFLDTLKIISKKPITTQCCYAKMNASEA